MWTAVFAVATIAAAMFIGSVKRAITSKTLHTTDYLLWSMWGNDVQDEGGWNHQQKGAATSTTIYNVDSKLLERKGKVRAVIDASATTTSDSTSWQ
jgi:hypothetical protein